jgi:uncharacterized protein
LIGTDVGVCWRTTATGALLRVRVTPKSSRDAVAVVVDTADGLAVTASVRAVPHDGAANKAVALALALRLDLPKSTVAVTAGTKSRIKTVALTGDPVDLAKVLAKRLAAKID